MCDRRTRSLRGKVGSWIYIHIHILLVGRVVGETLYQLPNYGVVPNISGESSYYRSGSSVLLFDLGMGGGLVVVIRVATTARQHCRLIWTPLGGGGGEGRGG